MTEDIFNQNLVLQADFLRVTRAMRFSWEASMVVLSIYSVPSTPCHTQICYLCSCSFSDLQVVVKHSEDVDH